MGQNFLIVLGLLLISVFMAAAFLSRGNKNQLFIAFILLSFPFTGIDLLPGPITFNLFDFTVCSFVIMFYIPRSVQIVQGKSYLSLFILLSCIVVIGLYNAQSLSVDSISSGIQYFSIFCFAKIFLDEAIYNPELVFKVMGWMRITLMFALFFLGCQFVFGTQFTFEKSLNANINAYESTRYPGFFQDPQKFSQFLAANSFLLLFKRFDAPNFSKLNLALFAGTLLSIMFTGGRGGFGGWCLGVMLIVLLGDKRFRIAALGFGSVLFIIGAIFSDKFILLKRTTDLGDDYDFRFAIWRDAVEIFKEHPFWGIGMGNYANYVSVHNPDQYWIANNIVTYFDHPESGYLKLLTEYGLIGMICIFTFILIPVAINLKLFFEHKHLNYLLLVAALISWMVGFYSVYSFGDVRIRILIVTIIVLLMSSFGWRKSNNDENALEKLGEGEIGFSTINQ